MFEKSGASILRQVLLVCDTTAPGGVDRYVIGLALMGRRCGWEVCTLVDDHPDTARLQADLQREFFPVISGPLHKRYSEEERRTLVESVITQTNPQIAHVILPAPWAGVIPREVALAHRLPLFATEQLVDASFYLVPELRERIHRCYEQSVVHIAVSQANRRLLIEKFGFPAAKLMVIPNAVDTALWKPGTEQEKKLARAEYGFDKTKVMLCPARLDIQKGIDVLLSACAGLRRQNWLLLIAGIGPDEIQLKEQAVALGIDDRVRWLGWRNDIQKLLLAVDLFVLPSRYEGQPFALLEAMAAGTPVVAAAVSGIPEAVDGGRLGRLAPPEDPVALAEAIEKTLDDPHLDRQVIEARSFMEKKFDLTVNLRRTVDLWTPYV